MLWGGRFDTELDSFALRFSSSLSFDINLILEDLAVSKAHAEMLVKVNLISGNDATNLVDGLIKIEEEWKAGNWKPDENKFEDIHSAVESRLFELIGDTAGKLHTGRSRNDQVATDFRLWIRKASEELNSKIECFQYTLANLAEKHTNTLMPGYTHLQRAQPVSFAFHLLAYVEMFERDKKRIRFVIDESDSCPLGCGALAGSTLPLDREFTAAKLASVY